VNKLLFVSLGAGALLGLAAAGCTPSFDHLDFSPQTVPPLAISISPTEVQIPEGIAVAVAPVAMAQGEALTSSVVIITSTDTGVLGISPENGAPQNNAPQTFVMFGVRPGSVGITVVVDGEEKEVIPATVTAQP
jgi:hypothetical protein